LGLPRFGGFQFGPQIGRHLLESFPVGDGVHGLREALRARAICSSRNSLLLAMASSCFDALSHGPMRGAVVCYGSGNLKGSKTFRPARC
jgi:hypothetical protein